LKTIHIFFIVFILLFGLLFSFRAGLFENFYSEPKKETLPGSSIYLKKRPG